MTLDDKVRIRRAAMAVWNDICFDVLQGLLIQGVATISRSDVIGLVVDADRMLTFLHLYNVTAQAQVEFLNMSMSQLRVLLNPAFNERYSL